MMHVPYCLSKKQTNLNAKTCLAPSFSENELQICGTSEKNQVIRQCLDS